MAAATPIVKLSQESQDGLIQYYRACTAILSTTWNFREQLMDRDRAYMREQDYTEAQIRARLANRRGDATKFQNVTVPVVMPQVETAVTYQNSVFLTGVPIFGVSGGPRFMDAALQMESLIDYQATYGGWTNQLEMVHRDGFKYNFGAAEIAWTQKKVYTPESNASTREAKPVETIWEGNTVKRWDPYNMIFDARYKPTEIATRGEFVGHTEVMSKIELIQFMQSLQFRINWKKAFESGPSTVGTAYPLDYFVPELNPFALIDQNMYQTTNWLVWAGLETKTSKINYKNVYFLTTFYARIIPADFKIQSPTANLPQIWKIYIVNGNTVIYAERQTNAHDILPVLIMQPTEDGLGYQTKSFAENVTPYQQIASALMNSSMASRRRAISDRGIYDPTRINAKDINSDSPNAKIPVRPAAYGKPLNEAYYAIPYRDDQIQFAMSDMSQVLRFADQAAGQNQAQQGQFVKGNKTLQEFDTIMGNASGRQQSTALKIQAQFYTPLKEIIKLNILQYQGKASVYNREREENVDIDPVTLRQAQITFKMSDGQLPASKQMNSEAFAVAAQTIASSPAIQGAYNLGPMFSYLFKSQRADVAEFEKGPEQIAYEQAVTQWQQVCLQIADMMSKMKKPDGSSPLPQEIQQAFPPQPTPQQFNYVPGQPKVRPQDQGTILQQYATAAAPPPPPQSQQVGVPTE